MNALKATIEANIDRDLESMRQELEQLTLSELSKMVTQELSIPLPKGKNSKNKDWMIHALLITKEVDLFQQKKIPIPSNRFQQHIVFFRNPGANTESTEDEIREEVDDVSKVVKCKDKSIKSIKTIKTNKSKEKIMEHKQSAPEGTPKHRSKKDELKEPAAKTKREPKTKVEGETSERASRVNITSGKRIVAVPREFRRKESNQARVYAQIAEAGNKGLTYDELMEKIQTNVPTEKKVKEAAWWAFWFFPKKGWAKLVDEHHKK